MDLKKIIRNIPDFPKKGVVFRDITTLLKDPKAMRFVIEKMKAHYKNKKIDLIVGPESRGFIFGAILAYELGLPFSPIRKPGKLPAKTESLEYELEYGKDKIEIHVDAVKKGDKILVCDDLLATGGTAKAAAELIEKIGGKVAGFCFLIELDFLHGREKIKDYDVFSLVHYERE